MKKNITLFLLVLSLHTMIAQISISDAEKIKMHSTFVSKMMQSQTIRVNEMHKTDGFITSRRVVSQSKHDNTLVSLEDSVKVTYTGESSSTYDYNTMVYAYNYPYNTSPFFGFNGIFTKPQIQYAHYTHWQINPNTLVYGFYQKDDVTYDASKNLLSDTAFYADSLVLPNMLHLNKFNAANKIESSYSCKYRGGIVDSAFKQYFVYDGANKLIKDSMYEFHAGAWYVVSRSIYTYDLANNLTLINNYSNVSDTTFLLPLIEQLQYANTYDVSNRLSTVQTSFHDGTSLRAYVRDTFEYTGISAFHTAWRQHQYDRINSRWEPTSNMTKHLNAAGLPDTINIKGYDRIAGLWTPSAMYLCNYDTFGNPTQLRDYQFNFISFPSTPDFTTYYFYETYSIDTGNGNIGIQALQTQASNVFPNPTNGIITIKGLDPANPILNVSLVDMNGRLYRNQEVVNDNGIITLSILDMNPGTFILLLADQNGVLIDQKLIIKE